MQNEFTDGMSEKIEDKQSNTKNSLQQEQTFTLLYQCICDKKSKAALDLLTTLPEEELACFKEIYQDELKEILSDDAAIAIHNVAPPVANIAQPQRRRRRIKCSIL